VSKSLLFLTVGAIVLRLGHVYIDDLAGIGRKMPITMAAFVLGGLSIIGVPGTAGFITKWHLGIGAVEAGSYWMVFLMVASSIISVLYIGRVVEVVYFRPVATTCETARDPDWPTLVPIGLMAFAVVWFGINTTYSADLARDAAEMLLGGLRQ